MNQEKTKRVLTVKRKIQFTIISLLLGFMVIIAFGEILIRIVNPQPYLYPRWQYSSSYGAILYPNVTMVNKRPGIWKFKYQINSLRYRGKPVPIAKVYRKNNIVVLGDSYGFGTGVNDGEEFAAILGRELKENHEVINLSVGGWGLTQHIRRFYEFGKLYQPKIVILQYCKNDLRDNFSNRVTVIKNDEFKFVNSELSVNWVKKYMSKSFIQKSQIYNLFRNNIYKLYEDKEVDAQLNLRKAENNNAPKAEIFYADLLTLFAEELGSQGISVIMISVNGDLEKSDYLKSVVNHLNRTKHFKYVNVNPWFASMRDYGSPEGHIWGKKGHKILGENLVKVIKAMESEDE